jgi:hypothetical protein
MKNSKIIATLALFAIGTMASAALRAQTADSDVHVPVIARSIDPPTTTTTPTKKTPPAGTSWLRAQVVHVDNVSIIVSEIGNPRMVHTFTYADDNLKQRMQQVVNTSAYQYGDPVRILYKPQTTVALKIHLKHTKTTS